MPQLDQFPKSQQVTFKYYEGVLFFLEENYMEVRLSRAQRRFIADCRAGREPPSRGVGSLPRRCAEEQGVSQTDKTGIAPWERMID